MWYRILSAALALTLAQPVSALSCLRPDVVRQYEQARDSDDLYSMVIGTIAATPPIAIPEPDANGNYPDGAKADTKIRITGRELTGTGFAADFDREVIVRARCLSVWCASAPEAGQDVFLTLRHADDDLLLEISPCPTNALPWSADDEARVLNCHRFQKCTASE